MRLMSAGDGYKYLLRTVAAGDGDRDLSTPLTRYYNADGTPPGRWMGSGLAALGSGQLEEGDEVTEAQLQLLIGMGRDPLTGAPLGRAYPQYKAKAERVADRVATLDPGLSATARGRAVAAIETEEAERATRRAVAGYDYTFSIPKSASVLWAVADAGTQSLIVDAHHAAVAEVVAFMEREVAATRAGATPGDGAVAQVDVRGLIATAYDHYDSRAGDPHLHTHVVISNKVQTMLDNKWRSLDSRPMHAATVALSELHEAVFADHLTRLLGVEWEARDRGRDRNPAWAIAQVPQELVTEFSSRSRHIDEEKDRLIAEYVAKHGRQPSSTTIIKLRARATLATRPEKQIHSLAELTAQWRERAGTILGADATSWARRVTTNEDSLLLRADDVPLDVVHRLGESVVAAVGEKRSTWRHWNLTAEAARQTMGYRFASTRDREAIVGLVVDAAETVSLRLTPPDLASSPAVFRRSDESSVFRSKNSTVFSSGELLEAEGRLLQLARATAGPTVSLATVERILQKPDREGRILAEDQTSALTAIAVSGKTVDLLVGPAGAGKTTAMSALRRACERGRRSTVRDLSSGSRHLQARPRYSPTTLGSQRKTQRSGGRPISKLGRRSRLGSSSSSTRPRLQEHSHLTASPSLPPRREQRCCSSETSRSCKRLTRVERSGSSRTTAMTSPNSSMFTASRTSGRNAPPSISATATQKSSTPTPSMGASLKAIPKLWSMPPTPRGAPT